jgi:hypothetical protein
LLRQAKNKVEMDSDQEFGLRWFSCGIY